MLVFQSNVLIHEGYIDLNLQSDKDSHRSTSDLVFTFEGATIS